MANESVTMAGDDTAAAVADAIRSRMKVPTFADLARASIATVPMGIYGPEVFLSWADALADVVATCDLSECAPETQQGVGYVLREMLGIVAAFNRVEAVMQERDARYPQTAGRAADR